METLLIVITVVVAAVTTYFVRQRQQARAFEKAGEDERSVNTDEIPKIEESQTGGRQPGMAVGLRRVSRRAQKRLRELQKSPKDRVFLVTIEYTVGAQPHLRSWPYLGSLPDMLAFVSAGTNSGTFRIVGIMDFDPNNESHMQATDQLYARITNEESSELYDPPIHANLLRILMGVDEQLAAKLFMGMKGSSDGQDTFFDSGLSTRVAKEGAADPLSAMKEEHPADPEALRLLQAFVQQTRMPTRDVPAIRRSMFAAQVVIPAEADDNPEESVEYHASTRPTLLKGSGPVGEPPPRVTTPQATQQLSKTLIGLPRPPTSDN